MTDDTDVHGNDAVRRLSAVLMMLACSKGPPTPLVAGQDACEFCRMTITDARFGGEVVLSTGKRYAFDSIECLATFLATEPDPSHVTRVWVADFVQRRLVDASSAVFVRGGSLRSPMGRELAAFGAGVDTAALRARYGGNLLQWDAVRDTARVGYPAERTDGRAASGRDTVAR